jgi:hypothetical protein
MLSSEFNDLNNKLYLRQRMKKNKNIRIKIHGNLKSTLRRNSPEITVKNIMKSPYLEIKPKYKPTILITQLILNFILLSIGLYFGLFLFIMIFLINYIIIWAYSLISITKNSFKERSNKLLWLILILIVPFSAFIYPDFKKIQVVHD